MSNNQNEDFEIFRPKIFKYINKVSAMSYEEKMDKSAAKGEYFRVLDFGDPKLKVSFLL